MIVIIQTIFASSSEISDGTRIFYKRFAELNSENLEENVKRSGFNGYLVFFGARWCGHSKQFNKTYKDLADKVYSGYFNRSPMMGYYNIVNPNEDNLHKLFRVKGFPSLIYLAGDKYWTYPGDRKLDYIMDWLNETFTEGLTREGTPYPTGDLTVWDDLGEIARDMKYSLKFNLNRNPTTTWIVIIMVTCSIGSVLLIFCILVTDSLFLTDTLANDIKIDDDKKEK